MCLTFLSEFEKHYLQVVLLGSITATATIHLICSRCTMAFFDFTNVIVLLIRAAVTFILFQAIENEWAGFVDVDLKVMHDSINMIMLPCILLCTVNMKVDLLLTFPLVILCNYFTFKYSFTSKGENMACYLQPGNLIAK